MAATTSPPTLLNSSAPTSRPWTRGEAVVRLARAVAGTVAAISGGTTGEVVVAEAAEGLAAVMAAEGVAEAEAFEAAETETEEVTAVEVPVFATYGRR